ncbi:hypothetical protein [Kribbella sp. C-35]|uniref:hypothetical protein n=1 Tax=Kribbella sp. C-35 TaxID=2789276 RepID=UPI00397E6231
MTAEADLAGFIDKFAPDVQDLIRGCRTKMRALFPDAVELVYDNYNFLVIGYSPTVRPSQSIFSVAAHKRGVNLCFLQRAAELPDPTSILRGEGNTVRNTRVKAAEDLDRPDVRDLIDAALRLAAVPMAAAIGPQLIVRSVSAKQRPRR